MAATPPKQCYDANYPRTRKASGMERLLKIGAGALAFLSAAALAATAFMVVSDNGIEITRNSSGAPAPPPPATMDYDAYIPEIPGTSEALPKLTESQIEDVKAAVNSDAALKDLLNGVPFTISNMGVWITGKERELVGALVVVKLDNPVSYDGALPSVESYDNPPDKPELYAPGEPLPTQARGIEELTILVDLHTREVVSIEISGAAEVTFVGYEPKLSPPIE